MYQVIPRKFRPKRFEDVMGHQEIVTLLKNALRFNRVAQAYLFYGSHGTGKTTLARLFAKALNCHHLSPAGEPCNECISCIEMLEGRSFDILEIDGASNRGIDDIRKLNETIGYAASSGKYKIYIIDEVHMLTKEAFSALLKTLEEPPPFVKFFFATTDPDKVLPSIRSRCQSLQLSRLSPAAIQTKLTSIAQELQLDIEETALHQIAHLAEGSLRDAESLLDQLACYGEGPLTLEKAREVFGLLPLRFCKALDEAILSNQIERARQLSEELFSNGTPLSAALDTLQKHFHSHLIDKSLYSPDQCLQFLDLLLEAEQQITKTPFKRIHIEMLFIHLVHSYTRISLEQLIQRLLALENRLQIPSQPEAKQKLSTPEDGSSYSENPIETEPCKPMKSSSVNENSVAPIPAKAKESQQLHQSHYDTLLRFAAIELEGTIKTFH